MRVNSTIVVGCWNNCKRLFDDWYPLTNRLRTLIKPAMDALNLSFTITNSQPPKKYDGTILEDSMVAKLANQMDIWETSIVMNSARFQVLNESFSYPHEQTELVFAAP